MLAACGGNDPNPRIVAGGGISDGAIDGELNVGVIDHTTYVPIAAAVDYLDDTGNTLLEITVFDTKTTSITVPDLVALPASGALTAKVNGIAADFDVTDFSLDADRDQLTGISAQPATIQ